MLKFAQWTGGIALVVACVGASARMHQICYEGIPEYKNAAWVPNAVFGCAIDGGGSCTISGVSPGMIQRSNTYPLSQYVQAAGTFKYFDLVTSAGTVTAKVEFFDGNSVKLGERFCTVNARGVYSSERGYASPGAVLTSFSTDSSGLAMSGVWRLQATTAYTHVRLAVQAPSDFVAVGGGGIGADAPMGALIAESMRSGIYAGDERTWKVRTAEASGASNPHQATAYVIGLHIEGVAQSALVSLLQQVASPANLNYTNHLASTATQPVIGGSVVIGGGFEAFAQGGTPIGTLLGQWGTVTAPQTSSRKECFADPIDPLGRLRCRLVTTVIGWRAESKDHVIAAPGWLNAYLFALPPTVTVNGQVFQVQARHVTATSAQAAHPAVDVGGLRGEFALTGIGATVNWRQYDQYGNQVAAGNLLWKLEPRADLGGASVASKDHMLSSPATITGHAIGIKLVP